MSGALTTTETTQLTNLETTIDRGLQSFFEVGAALKEIRDSRLYRAEHGTFEDYCDKRWGFKRAHAYRYIDSATLIEDLSPMGDILPTNERQCRPLTKLPDCDRQTAWQTVVERAGAEQEPITAKLVQDVVDELSQTTVTPIGDRGYSVVYADPPWKYGDERNHATGGAAAQYPTMSISDLSEMNVNEVTAPDAVLFLWVTVPLLSEAWPLIDAWGFKYKTHLVWDKGRPFYGHYSHVQHELLCVCTRGSCTPADGAQLPKSVIAIPRQNHSSKPHEFYDIIDSLYPHGNRIELFARNRREGWDAWGNEAEQEDQR